MGIKQDLKKGLGFACIHHTVGMGCKALERSATSPQLVGRSPIWSARSHHFRAAECPDPAP
jgi:hypothetical protein